MKIFRIKHIIRSSLRKQPTRVFRLSCWTYENIIRCINSRHWEKLVGYTLEELKEHLEKQFDENMNWDNYGTYWEVDHIIPKNQFKYVSTEDKDFKICWSLMNLRPLSKQENVSRPRKGQDISEELKQSILNQNI